MAAPTTASHFSPFLPSAPTPRRTTVVPLRRIRRPRLAAVASVPDPAAGPVEYTPWLITGLGNPGDKYYGTRHNVGFGMVDRIARDEGVTTNTIQSKSLLGCRFNWRGSNLAGETTVVHELQWRGSEIGPLAAYYQVPLRHILLIYDEMNLPNGVLRLQSKGGYGRHNGLQNVIQHMDGCRELPRLSIGIGSPPGKMDTRAFLLQKFSPEERLQIDTALEQGVDTVRTLVLKGFSGSIERFNLVQKYKFHRV